MTNRGVGRKMSMTDHDYCTIEAKRTRNTRVRGALSVARARRLDQPQRWLKLGEKKGGLFENPIGQNLGQ